MFPNLVSAAKNEDRIVFLTVWSYCTFRRELNGKNWRVAFHETQEQCRSSSA